jgi:hypothetical protein
MPLVLASNASSAERHLDQLYKLGIKYVRFEICSREMARVRKADKLLDSGITATLFVNRSYDTYFQVRCDCVGIWRGTTHQILLQDKHQVSPFEPQKLFDSYTMFAIVQP